MSQLLLVATDLRKTKRSSTFLIPKGDYRFECSDVDLGFHLVFGNGNKIAIKHGDPIPVPEASEVYLDLPEANRVVTCLLGDL